MHFVRQHMHGNRVLAARGHRDIHADLLFLTSAFALICSPYTWIHEFLSRNWLINGCAVLALLQYCFRQATINGCAVLALLHCFRQVTINGCTVLALLHCFRQATINGCAVLALLHCLWQTAHLNIGPRTLLDWRKFIPWNHHSDISRPRCIKLGGDFNSVVC